MDHGLAVREDAYVARRVDVGAAFRMYARTDGFGCVGDRDHCVFLGKDLALVGGAHAGSTGGDHRRAVVRVDVDLALAEGVRAVLGAAFAAVSSAASIQT